MTLSLTFVVFALVATAHAAFPCTVANQTGCAVDQYCANYTTYTTCNPCSMCTGPTCPVQCHCSGNADCPALVGYCAQPQNTCEPCSVTAYGSNEKANCQCATSASCPATMVDTSLGQRSLPMYCSRRMTKDHTDPSLGYFSCESCHHCYGNYAIEGFCPDKCSPAYECTSHANCTSGSNDWCDNSHKCKACGVTCYVGSSHHESSIDGVCPMACCNFMDMVSMTDGAPMVWAPCERNTSVPFAFRWAYKQLTNSTDGFLCTAVETEGETDDNGTRRIFTVKCGGFDKLYSTCDDAHMHVYVSVFTGTVQAMNWDKYSDNTLSCTIGEIAGVLAIWMVILIAVPVGICVLVCIVCACMSYVASRREKQDGLESQKIIFAQHSTQGYGNEPAQKA